MKRIITLSTICLSIILSNLYGQNSGGMSPPDFNAEKAAGIFQYDIDEVVKKIKIVDSIHQNAVTAALSEYNKEMDELSLLNASEFRNLEDDFDRNIQIAIRNRDRSQMDGVKAEIQRIIPPIRNQVIQHEKALNESMALIVSDQQYQKWLKYQERKRKSEENQ
jgi:hypothetical protein